MVQATLKTNKQKNEWNNEQSKHSIPFQNVLSNSWTSGHKISEQAEHLWIEQVPYPLLTFLDSNNHAALTITHYNYTYRTW